MQASVKGTTMPILEVALGQGEEIIATHGELAWMTAGIQMSQTAAGGGGGGGFMRGVKRAMGGGGLFLTRYAGPGSVTFAAKVPGHIVPVDIAPGQVWLQSMPLAQLAHSIEPFLPVERTAEAGAAGGLVGGMLRG